MSFLERIQAANRCQPSDFRPLCIGGRRFGYIRQQVADFLSEFWQFQVLQHSVELCPELVKASVEQRTVAIKPIAKALQQAGLSSPYWWDELYAVNTRYGESPVFLIERGALQALGICGYGVHLNGFVHTAQGIGMWIARRALDKPIDPGKLDQIVAGGQPADLGLKQNLIKECAEEASLPAALAQQAQAVGLISYCLQTREGLRPDIVFCYDLELPPDFVPKSADGEVDSFELWPIQAVLERVRDTVDFKFNCALVVIDFLLRHGMIDPDECEDYMMITQGLRQRATQLAAFQ